MPCYSPIKAWRFKNLKSADGKSVISFSDPYAKESSERESIKVPCGLCVGCLHSRAKQWAIRCMHEASLYSDNCFITLTFDEKNMDLNRSLVKSDFQNFLKRLRKKFCGCDMVLDKNGKMTYPIRYFHCGEYGSKLDRPHHHACLFNFDFPDKKVWQVKNGVILYRSESLEKLWTFGFSTIGDVSYDSACYVARYCLKKAYGDCVDDHYDGRVPEYNSMSLKPGIGHDWLKQFASDVYPHDQVVVRKDLILKPPKYYDKIYDIDNPDQMAIIKEKRKEFAINSVDNTDDRLRVREKVALAKLKRKVRRYEAVSF